MWSDLEGGQQLDTFEALSPVDLNGWCCSLVALGSLMETVALLVLDLPANLLVCL